MKTIKVNKMSFNTSTDKKVKPTQNFFVSSPVDQVRCRKFCDSSGNVSVKVERDIYLLFNQERLNKLGTDSVNNWLNTLNTKSDSLSYLRSNCTDEQLLSLCKSRYIQSASELLAWSEYLAKRMQELQAVNKNTSQVEEENISDTSVSESSDSSDTSN